MAWQEGSVRCLPPESTIRFIRILERLLRDVRCANVIRGVADGSTCAPLGALGEHLAGDSVGDAADRQGCEEEVIHG